MILRTARAVTITMLHASAKLPAVKPACTSSAVRRSLILPRNATPVRSLFQLNQCSNLHSRSIVCAAEMVETADAETDAEALPIEAPQTSLKWVSWEEVGHLYNAISLIGILAKPVELKSVRDMVVANTLLSVRSGTRDAPTTLWLDVEAWDTVAQLAHAELDKGSRIHVIGRLKISEWTDRNGIKQKNLRVVATEIKRVLPAGQSSAPEPSVREAYGEHSQVAPDDASHEDQTLSAPGFNSAATPSSDGTSAPGPDGARAAQAHAGVANSKWEQFFASRGDYWDNRTSKRNPRAPDFKHKSDPQIALWIDSRDTPAWVMDELKATEPAEAF